MIVAITILPWTLFGGYAGIQAQSDEKLPQFFTLLPLEWWIIILLAWLLIIIAIIFVFFAWMRADER